MIDSLSTSVFAATAMVFAAVIGKFNPFNWRH
jgi:hypothetical protein